MASRDAELNLIGNDRTGAATRSAASNLDQLRNKLNRFNATARRDSRRGGVDAAADFIRSFVGALTLGLRGSLTSKVLATPLGAVGATLGGVLGAAVVTAAAAAITAGLPLLVAGGLIALPFIHLAKTQKEAVDKLKKRWRGFLDFISKPLTVPFVDVLGEIGDGLDRLKRPLTDLMRAIGPALAPFTKGVMDGLLAFVEALKPAMPGIVAGMQAWAKVAPGIGKALGDLIAAILKDPDRVVQTIESISKALTVLARVLGILIPFLTELFVLWQKWGSLLTLGAKLGAALQGAWVVVQAKGALILGWFRALPGRAGAAISGLAGSIGRHVSAAASRAATGARNLVTRVANFLRPLPGRASSAVAGLAGNIGRHVSAAASRAATGARNLVTRVANFLRPLPGRAGSAVAALPGRLASVISRAAGAARAAAARIVNAVVSMLATLPGRAMAVISGLGARIAGAIGGIVSRARSALGGISLSAGSGWVPAYAGGQGWMNVLDGSGHRTGGPSPISVEAPIVNVRNIIDGRQFDARIRTTVVDENRRNAHRARVGRR